MLVPKAARRYAEALYDLAKSEGCLERVMMDTSAIGALLPGSPDLARFLPDYTIPRRERLGALEGLFKSGCCELSWRFLLFLEGKKRMALLSGICGTISGIHDRNMGVVDVALTTALPAESVEMETISGEIRTKLAGTIRLSSAIDRDLIGGFMFRVGDKVYDYSVRGAFRALRKKMETGNAN